MLLFVCEFNGYKFFNPSDPPFYYGLMWSIFQPIGLSLPYDYLHNVTPYASFLY